MRRIVKESKGGGDSEESPEEAKTVKVVTEYVAVETEKVAAGLGGRKDKGEPKGGPVNWLSKEAIENFLKHIKRVLAKEMSFYRQQLEQLSHDERLVFKLSIASIVMAMALVPVGLVLIITGLLTVGNPNGRDWYCERHHLGDYPSTR